MQANARDSRPLPRHCSSRPATEAIDRVLFDGTVSAIGQFRCPVGHPAFVDSGPIERCIVVFPRTSVWISHEGSRPFVADPNVVTIYNRAQRYERAPLSPDGDRCDWFAVSDDTAREIASAFDPAAGEGGDRPFRFQYAASSTVLYVRQRRLTHRVALGGNDPLEVEAAVIDLVSSVLACAYGGAVPRPDPFRPAQRRHLDIAERAKVELLRTFKENRSVSAIAQAVGTSAYHLCRVFRSQTGRTMHAYRTELRVRAALERIADGGATLSTIAHDLGFASHSHLVRLCHQHLGVAPNRVREQLRAPALV